MQNARVANIVGRLIYGDAGVGVGHLNFGVGNRAARCIAHGNGDRSFGKLG